MKFLVALVILSLFNHATPRPEPLDPALKSLKNAEEELPVGLCSRGRTFVIDDCNRCWCNPENGATMCTLVGCYTMEFEETKSSEVFPASKSMKTSDEPCPFGEVYSPDNCNTCWCNPDPNGDDACTRRDCLTLEQPLDDI